MSRRYVKKSLRFKVIQRDCGLCWVCDLVVLPEDVSMDHVIRVADGGKTSLDNLRLAHKRCNSSRHQAPSLRNRKKSLKRKAKREAQRAIKFQQKLSAQKQDEDRLLLHKETK